MMSDETISICYQKWSLAFQANNNYEFLCCLSIACRIQHFRASPQIGSSFTAPNDKSLLRWAEKAHVLLHGDKAYRVFRSTLLRALAYIMPDSTALCNDEIAEALNMIRRVFAEMDQSFLKRAMAEKENTQVFLKFLTKVESCKSSLKLIGFDIILNLDPDGRFWRTDMFWDLLESTNTIHDTNVDRVLLSGVVTRTLNIVALVTTNSGEPRNRLSAVQGILARIITRAIDQCRPGTRLSLETLDAIEHATSVIIGAIAAMTASAECRTHISDPFTQIALPEWWTMNLVVIEKNSSCHPSPICPYNVEQARLNLKAQISTLLLKALCAGIVILEPRDFDALMKSMTGDLQAISGSACSYPNYQSPMSRKQPISLPVLEATRSSRGYGDELGANLSLISQQTSELIRQHVSRVCYDLDRRCYDVEQPLREANTKIRELEDEVTSMRHREDSLRCELESQGIELQAQVDRQICHNKHLEQEVENLRINCARLEKEIVKGQNVKDDELKNMQSIVTNMQEDAVTLQAKLEDKITEFTASEVEKKVAEQQFQDTKNELTAEVNKLMVQLKEERSKNEDLELKNIQCTKELQSVQVQLHEIKEKEQRLMSILCENRSS